jgi:hypothetical protein
VIHDAPDLWDIATGEQIPGAEVANTKDFGTVVAGSIPVGKRSKAFRIDNGEIQPGDIILSVDGMRTYGWREFELARFRNGLASTMTLLINRKGDLLSVKLHDLQPGRDLGLQYDTNQEQIRFLDVAENAGISLADDKVRASLQLLPAHAAAALDACSKSKKSQVAADNAWLQEFINLYTSVQTRHYSNATAPAHKPPVPYFERLEKFYLAIAAANKLKEVAPSLTQSGEFPEFYVLALPVPDYLPPLGNLKFADLRFQALLARKYANDGRDDPEIIAAAVKYASSNADGLDQYLDQVRASLLDPQNQGGWPYRSYLLEKAVSRSLMEQQLTDRMKDKNSPDWPLDAYTMVSLKLFTGDSEGAASTLDDLGKQSFYLARKAAANDFTARHLSKSNWKGLDSIKKVLQNNGNFLGPDAPELYRWALDKVDPVALSSQESNPNPLADPHFLLTKAPYAELMALKGLQPPVAASAAKEPAGNNPGAPDDSSDSGM